MRKSILTLFLSVSLLTLTSAFASPLTSVTNNEVTLNFPESATFHATITSETDITSVVLEYGNEQQTCGDVIAKAFPQFTPGKTVNAEWIWEMRQSGSLPPGAQLWWRWRITDATGNETLTETKTTTWLDRVHQWQTVSTGDSQSVQLHWYQGDQAFANELAQAAAGGLKFNETQSGLKADAPIDLYIYANTTDMQDAILYEPSWTGGQAFPDQNIVILGISKAELDWGKDAIVHELTHVLVGHLTFSCLGDVPTWLNEGLAVYSEGGLDPQSQQQLDEAIRNNTLLTVRSLSGGFSEVADKAYLSYSESYSIAKFLIEMYGQEKMTALLVGLRDGLTIDEALTQTYGFNVDGLEDAWRKAIGAQPRTVSAPTAQPTPTFVPTIVPVGGVPVIARVTVTPVPTSSFENQPTVTPGTGYVPGGLLFVILALCCALLLLLGVIVLGVVLYNQNRKGGKNVQ